MLNHSHHEPEAGRTADSETQHMWHFQQPGDSSRDRWDPTPLTLACQTIANDKRRAVTRIHTIFLCPEIPGGAIEVVDYAQSLAADYGLTVHCAVNRGMVTVTFERDGASK